ncbi:hypothetical protein OH77DRAFT_1587865 [Trametes cingulata]|nr:hypothetical protein OH77DRAFT_1587865 [Trametes cingulata]
MDEVITKRIHISGLTPAISAKDLSDRLGSFGTVKSLDGFGALDALGQPRKFAYATLETTKGKLARCMNLLSGVTWKGAKLRLGEAKPDFRERIAQEHAALKRAAEEAANQPPKKRRRLPRGVQGVHASDMSLVTPENVKTRGGWRVTATGRLIRPVRMRPEHPLPEPLDSAKPEKAKGKSGKVRKRLRDPPTRARRRTIDPTKWGSTHLKGIFLENAAAFAVSTSKPAASGPSHASESESETEDEEDEDMAEDGVSEESDDQQDDEVSEGEELSGEAEPPRASARLSFSAPKQKTAHNATALPTSQQQPPVVTTELAEETSKALGLLQSLFGDKEEWGSAESVGSDVDEEDLRRIGNDATAAADTAPDEADGDREDAGAMDVDGPVVQEAPSAPESAPGPARGSEKTKLKDLFAPREEEAGFSLLGHLDLDLELEDDVPFDLPGHAPATAPSEPLRPIQPATTQVQRTAALDPSKPLFFPSDSATSKRRVLDPTNWRTWFYRTDTPEAIRQRWEESKGELTAGWKRRHREAIKSRRRRGGGAGEAD